MDPRRAIGRERRRANQFGQLTRGPTPQQIHLKKTFLRMNPTQRTRYIKTVGPAQRRHPKRIARYHDFRRQTSGARRALKLGPAGPQFKIKPTHPDHRCEQTDTHHARDDF